MKVIVDFNHIEPHQLAIHERLVNWSAWLSTKPKGVVQPMFKFYKAPPQWEPKGYRAPCDILDAQLLEKQVYKLPEIHRLVLRWFYVYSKMGMTILELRKESGLTNEGIHRHSRDSRQMLINQLD